MLIVGCGGLGCPSGVYLAAAGIGQSRFTARSSTVENFPAAAELTVPTTNPDTAKLHGFHLKQCCRTDFYHPQSHTAHSSCDTNNDFFSFHSLPVAGGSVRCELSRIRNKLSKCLSEAFPMSILPRVRGCRTHRVGGLR